MKDDFLKELKALLVKHNASIDWSCHWSSDTHGITDDHIQLIIGNDVVFRTESGRLDAGDLP